MCLNGIFSLAAWQPQGVLPPSAKNVHWTDKNYNGVLRGHKWGGLCFALQGKGGGCGAVPNLCSPMSHHATWLNVPIPGLLYIFKDIAVGVPGEAMGVK